MGNTHGKPETALLIYLKEKKKKKSTSEPFIIEKLP